MILRSPAFRRTLPLVVFEFVALLFFSRSDSFLVTAGTAAHQEHQQHNFNYDVQGGDNHHSTNVHAGGPLRTSGRMLKAVKNSIAPKTKVIKSQKGLKSSKRLKGPKGNKSSKNTTESPKKSYNELECFSGLLASGFDLTDFENYNNFFDQDSVLTLPQAGVYKGPEGIQEYVAFKTPIGPYYNYLAPVGGPSLPSFVGYDVEKETCYFRILSVTDYGLDPNVTCRNTVYSMTSMIGIEFNPEKKVVSTINVFLDDPFISFLMGELASTNCARNFVCNVMSSDICSNPVENCEEKLAALPIVTEQANIDGNSQGCRFIHAVLATFNDFHCPHIAFEPTEDRNGEIKCQTSENIEASDFFEESEFLLYKEYQKSVGIPPGVGYVVKQAS